MVTDDGEKKLNGIRTDVAQEDEYDKFREEALSLTKHFLYSEKNNKYPISFDFDGTITQNNDYPECFGLRIGIKWCIQQLYSLGFPIIIHTCRTCGTPQQTFGYNKMVSYLGAHGIPYCNINKSIDFDSGKPYAIVYIDDATLDWNPNITGYELFIKIVHYLEKLNILVSS